MKKLHHPQNLINAAHIPNWLIQIPCTLLSFGAKLTYARLCKWAGKDGKAYRSYTQLSKELGVSPSQIKRYLRDLKEAELIATFHPQAGGMNHFTFFEHEWMTAAIVDELLYNNDPGADVTRVPGADVTLPWCTSDPTPGADVTRIKGNKALINTTTTQDQILNSDSHLEPVVVTSLSSTPTSTPESVPSISIFISTKYDSMLLEAYRKKPVKTKNIKDEVDYLSACKFEVDHRPEGISIPARVNQRIKFTLEGTFEEPLEWANNIVKQRNARIAEENLKKHEAHTLLRVKEQMKDIVVKPGREGFAHTLEMLKDVPDQVSYAEKNADKRFIFKPYRLPEDFQGAVND